MRLRRFHRPGSSEGDAWHPASGRARPSPARRHERAVTERPPSGVTERNHHDACAFLVLLNDAHDSPAPPGGYRAPRPRGVTGRLRRRRGGKALRCAISIAAVVAAFAFALPHFASYRGVWASLQAMSWGYAALVGVAAAASLASYWFAICAVLPSLRLREAAAVNLGSNAVASTLPAGGALGMGVSWAMLSSWDISTTDYVVYTLVSGVWNVFARLSLPVLAVLALLTVTRPDTILITGAAVGLALLAAAVAGLGLLLRSERFSLRAGHVVQRTAAMACRLARRPAPRIADSVAGFRGRAAGLVAMRGWRITITTTASQLILWLVLLACLRGNGLAQAQVSWQASLAAYAFVRLLTVLPITPGGLGVTELGLVSGLAAGAGHAASAQVTAAVLLYRAVTYLPSIPLGVGAWLVWRHAPALLHPSRPGRVAFAPASGASSIPGDRRARPMAGEPGPAGWGAADGCDGAAG